MLTIFSKKDLSQKNRTGSSPQGGIVPFEANATGVRGLGLQGRVVRFDVVERGGCHEVGHDEPNPEKEILWLIASPPHVLPPVQEK